MNRAHFSEYFVKLFFEVHDCPTNNHSRQTFKLFLSKYWGSLSYSYSQMVLGHLKGKPRGTFGHQWPSHFSLYSWNLNKVRCHWCQISPWFLPDPNPGAEQEVSFCFLLPWVGSQVALCLGELLTLLPPKVFSQPWSGFFWPSVEMRQMDPHFTTGEEALGS